MTEPKSANPEINPTFDLTPYQKRKQRAETLRRRQASVATILDSMFGRIHDCDPRLWEQRAYLLLVGMIYERLAIAEKELSTTDLVSLSKALAEHRRINTPMAGPTRNGSPDGNVNPTPGKNQKQEPAGKRAKPPPTDAREKPTPPGTKEKLPPHVAQAVRDLYGTDS